PPPQRFSAGGRPALPRAHPAGRRRAPAGRRGRAGGGGGPVLSRLRLLLAAAPAREAAASAGAGAALWTFPSILASAFVIAWASEVAQFFISQGLALAILAWLQFLPVFAVDVDLA